MIEDMKLFWEKNHQENSLLWLTKSQPDSVYSMHGIEDLIYKKEHLRIAEIGVGYGDSIELISKNHTVFSIDISDTALSKVKNISTICNTKDFINIDSNNFDLILSHLVLQHCNKDMVEYLISNSIRCIKDNGFCSFQFAYLPDINKTDEFHLNGIKNGTHYFYSISDIEDIVNKHGGMIDNNTRIVTFDGASHNIIWYIIHIFKK